MHISELLQAAGIVEPNCPPLHISGITFDSRTVREGFLFVAINGVQTDGHRYIEEAIAKGAVAIIGETEQGPLSVPYYQVASSRKALGQLAKRFYPDVMKKKTLIGITGTNGKTTTAFMIRHLLQAQGISCGLLGTVSVIINDHVLPSTHTTLDALKFHELMSQSDDDVIVMEVSSHGLEQHRVEGIEFDYAVFSNLENEHLDYHGSIEAYFTAKKKLFSYLKPTGKAVINGDNSWGQRLYEELRDQHREVLLLGGSNKETLLHEGQLVTQQHEKYLQLPLNVQGYHNKENAAIALLIVGDMGADLEVVATELHTFPGVPGRFERHEKSGHPSFIIDYAHTEQAFIKVLQSVKTFAEREVYHVFGFRGGRDTHKRQKMMEASLAYADHSILTFDDLNGLTEDEMILQLEQIPGFEECVFIADRTEALAYVYNQAKLEDWIVVTGKGHEDYQQDYDYPVNSDGKMVAFLQGTQISTSLK